MKTADLVQSFDVYNLDGTPLPQEQMPNRAALGGGTPAELAVRFRARGSTVDRWSLFRSVPVRDHAGEVICAVNFLREVTDQHREEQQRAFLLRAIDELNASLDYERTLATIARLAVPTLADWCAVDLLEGTTHHRVAIAHVDPDKLRLVAELERRYPADPDSATGVPQSTCG